MTFMAGHQALLMKNNYVDLLGSFVRTLLHFDGNTTDSSPSNLTYTNSGGAVIASTGQLAGSGCLDCTAAGDAGCSAASTALALGTSDFCVEMFFYDADVGAINRTLFFLESAGGSFGINTTGVSLQMTGSPPDFPSATVYGFPTWNHLAITRSGSTWKLWLNGAEAQSMTYVRDFSANPATFYIGKNSGAGSGAQFRYDEVRVTIGNSRYTAPFTPSAPFPNP